MPVLLPSSTGQGLQISAQLIRRDGQIFYALLFENNTQLVLDGFMIQFNKNTFGLAAAGPLQVIVLLSMNIRNINELLAILMLFKPVDIHFLCDLGSDCPKYLLAFSFVSH